MRDAPSSEPLRAKAAPSSSPLRRFGLVVVVGLPLYTLSVGAAYAYGRAKAAEQVEAAVAAERSDQGVLSSTRATLKGQITREQELRDSYIARRAKLEAQNEKNPQDEFEEAKRKLRAWIDAERDR